MPCKHVALVEIVIRKQATAHMRMNEGLAHEAESVLATAESVVCWRCSCSCSFPYVCSPESNERRVLLFWECATPVSLRSLEVLMSLSLVSSGGH